MGVLAAVVGRAGGATSFSSIALAFGGLAAAFANACLVRPADAVLSAARNPGRDGGRTYDRLLRRRVHPLPAGGRRPTPGAGGSVNSANVERGTNAGDGDPVTVGDRQPPGSRLSTCLISSYKRLFRFHNSSPDAQVLRPQPRPFRGLWTLANNISRAGDTDLPKVLSSSLSSAMMA